MRRVGWLLFSFEGRIGRQEFILAVIGLTAALFGIGFLLHWAAGDSFWPLFIAVSVIAAWNMYALMAKRLHDRGYTGWLGVLIYAVPGILTKLADKLESIPLVALAITGLSLLFSLWAIIELYFIRGTVGPSMYGPDPLSRSPLSAPSEEIS